MSVRPPSRPASRQRSVRAAWLFILAGLVAGMLRPVAAAEPSDSLRVHRLFLIASSGEVRFRELVDPARDSLVAMGETAAVWLAAKMNATDARERHTLENLFKRIGSVAVPYLVPYLDSSGEYMPRNAARCLGVIRDTAATLPLLETLTNAHYAVRSQAATALGRIADPRAVTPLLDRLDDEPDGDVRKSCVVALGEIGSDHATDVLIQSLGDSFFGVRQTALLALTKINPCPVDALLKALRNLEGIARYGAIVALGGCDDRRTRGELLALLDRGDNMLRGFAVEGLAADSSEAVIERLRRLAETESDPFVRAQLRRALED